MIISIIRGIVSTINVTAEYPYCTDDNEARRVDVSTQEGVPKKQGKKHKNPPRDVISSCMMVVVLNETLVVHVVFAAAPSSVLSSSSILSRLATDFNAEFFELLVANDLTQDNTTSTEKRKDRSADDDDFEMTRDAIFFFFWGGGGGIQRSFR